MKHRRGTKEGGKQIRKRHRLSQFHWWLQDRSRLVRWVVLLDRRQASAEFSTATLTNSRGIHSIADQKARCLHSLSLHSLRLHERRRSHCTQKTTSLSIFPFSFLNALQVTLNVTLSHIHTFISKGIQQSFIVVHHSITSIRNKVINKIFFQKNHP